MIDYNIFNENQLVLLVQSSGESSAFGELVKLHQQPLMGFLTQFTHNKSVSEDLMQDTFIKAYQNINQFKATAKFKTWLFSIAYREYLNHIRKTKRFNVIHQSFHSISELFRKTKQSHNQDISVQMDVDNALTKLSESERTVMLLCDQLGMSHTEAAEILNLPLGTVKTHMRAARTAMQRYLGNPYDNK